MSADNDQPGHLQMLVRAAGLSLSEDAFAQVATLYDRFAASRALLAETPIGETEPAPIFQATRPDDRR